MAPRQAAALAAVAVVLALRLHPESAFYPPCPIARLTLLRCPGCGATRALTALLHGRIAEAWTANALFVLVLPFALAYLGQGYRRGAWPRPPRGVVPAALALTAAFTVARNLFGF